MSEFTRSTAQMLLQNTQADIVRKLRSATGQNEEEAIDQYLADTRKEVGSATQSVKVIALQKAMYFHMLGYSASYAAFNIVEVMADSGFANKRVGYVAACTTFLEDTDVIPLMTALLKRDLASTNQYEAGLALYCISSVCTPDLAKDVVADVVRLLTHTRSYVRKKAVLSLYKIFIQYPESLRPTFPRLKEKLDNNSELCDTDPAVRGAVVCVLCELARRNPANFLSLAVPFYALLSSIQSNWTLIKIVKVFGYFAPVEPRLAKKLVKPLTDLILTTGAKSVQYECLLAVANGMGHVSDLTKLAAEHLRAFVEDSDQNLKFLGLDAMARMVGDNAKLLMDQRETILSCLDDNDSTIRCKALEVLRDLTTKKNIVSTIDTMLDRCIRTPVDESWSNIVIATIVEVAHTDDYSLIRDFEWFMGVLLDISILDITEFAHGELIEHEIVAILLRVNGARQFGVEALSELLTNPRLLRCDRERSTQWMILRAAAFACGEYPYWLPDKGATCKHLLAEAISLLPADVQVACVTAVGKIAAYLHEPCTRHVELKNGEEGLSPLATDGPTVLETVKKVVEGDCVSGSNERDDDADRKDARADVALSGLSVFTRSVYPDVQERARLVQHQIMQAPELGSRLYEAELLPVAYGVQVSLSIPAGVDLATPFCENIGAIMALSESDASSAEGDESDGEADFDLSYRIEQQQRQEKARREEMSAFYLRESEAGERGPLLGVRDSVSRGDEAEESALSSGAGSPAASAKRSHRHRAQTASKVHGINREFVRPAAYVEPSVAGGGKGPRRTKSPEEDEATRRLRNIDVTRTLGADEKLPEAVPYTVLLQAVGARGSHGRGDLSTAATAVAAASPSLPPPVSLFEEKLHLRVLLYVDGCSAKKDGTELRCTVEVTNLAVTSALHDLTLSLILSEETYPQGSISLVSREGGGRDDSKDSEAAAGANGADQSVRFGEKIKASTTVRKKVALKFTPLPESLTAAVPFCVDYVKEKRRVSCTMELPLRYIYFAKDAPTSVSRETFMKDILGTALSEAPVMTAFIPCKKAAILVSVPAAQSDLRLAPMDVFKDAATYYGLLHGRMSHTERTHMAVLLREAHDGDERGVSISVRSHSTGVAELMIQDFAAIVQTSLTG